MSELGAGIVVLVPTLRRAHHIAPLVESVRSTAPGARLLFLATPHDGAVAEAIDRAGCERVEVPRLARGDYARKINEGYRRTAEPLIFTGASDLRFHPGWVEAVLAELAEGVGVIGTNDLGSPRVLAGEHATHSIVTRDYADRYGTIDQPGAIYHEGYPHEWCDDELVATAKFRGAWRFAAGAHIEHLHPSWGKGRNDPMYAQQRARMRAGRPIFEARRALWT